MSRGRRGGRRQRRRDEQARQASLPAQERKSNGQSGPAAVVLPAAAAPPAEPAHPRPMSARELVARLEKMRAQEQATHESAGAGVADEAVAGEPAAADHVVHPASAVPPAPVVAPRRFHARGDDWIATHAGRGAGGTGRVAHARLEAIRFASAVEPEHIVAEVLAPHARLDDLYDDELAALLEQALRYRKEDG